MPITFGSVGDIISVCLLVKDLVDALDKARGSKAEYQSLTRELRILDRVLLEVHLLARTHGGGNTPELEALCETARKAVDRCKDLVSNFLVKLKKYQGEKDAIEKFRVDIAGTSASLQMLLATASVNLIDIHGNRIEKRIADVQKRSEVDRTKADAALVSIQDKLEKTNRLISSGNSMTSSIADALRLDWLRQLGSELKGYMRRIIAMNIATYHAVLSIQSALPSSRERGLIEEPFILEDAIGRIAPVHLQFVTSWDAFNAVLEIRFRNLQGHSKVKKQQYGLQDKATKRDIDQGRNWEGSFLSGQRIEMSFLFDQENDRSHSLTGSTCPSCHTRSISPLTEEVQCENCNIWYRRITVIEEITTPKQPLQPAYWKSTPEFGRSGFESLTFGPAKPGKKRVSPTDPDGEDDIRCFKRIRIITKKFQTKQRVFGRTMTRSNLVSFAALSEDGIEQGGSKRPIRVGSSGFMDATDALLDRTMPSLDPASIIKQDLENARNAGIVSAVFDAARSEAVVRRPLRRSDDDYGLQMFGLPKYNPTKFGQLNYFQRKGIHLRKRPWKDNQWKDSGCSPGTSSDHVAFEDTDAKYSSVMEEGKFMNQTWKTEIYVDWTPHLIDVDPADIWNISARRLQDHTGCEWPDYHYIQAISMRRPTMGDFSCFPLEFKAEEYVIEDRPLWPKPAFTILLSFSACLASFRRTNQGSRRKLGFFTSRGILDSEATCGTAFHFPELATTFYGATFGRWLFDWTWEYTSLRAGKDYSAIRFIHALWQDLVIFEEQWRQPRLVSAMTETPKCSLRGASETHASAVSHFVIVYRGFWRQMAVYCGRIAAASSSEPMPLKPSDYKTSVKFFVLRWYAREEEQSLNMGDLLALCRQYSELAYG